MRRSEVLNSTAGDGRRFRQSRQRLTESDRRDHGRQPWALREGRSRRTRSSFPAAKGGSWKASVSPVTRRAAAGSGETEAGKEPIRARTVISGRRWPASPGGTTGLGPERPRAPAPGSPGRPRLPTRFVPRAQTRKAGGSVGKRPEARRSASRLLQLPIRESFSERGERTCRDEGQRPTRSQPDEAERGSQFNGGRWPAIPAVAPASDGIGPERP